MLDGHDLNNIYQYESRTAKFGYQKFYNTINTGKDNEFENSCYYLLVSAQIKSRVIIDRGLDSCEVLILLKEFLKNLLHTYMFTFEQ